MLGPQIQQLQKDYSQIIIKKKKFLKLFLGTKMTNLRVYLKKSLILYRSQKKADLLSSNKMQFVVIGVRKVSYCVGIVSDGVGKVSCCVKIVSHVARKV